MASSSCYLFPCCNCGYCYTVLWCSGRTRTVDAQLLLEELLCSVMYRVIEKDGLNFVSLYFKIRTSEKYDLNYISLDVEYQNKGETHAVQQSWTQF